MMRRILQEIQDYAKRRGWTIALTRRMVERRRRLLRGADLCGADLCEADLRGADLCGADLCEADLCEADLRGADLRGADLRGADLCGADLREADLRGADLCEADLRGADLRGADLRGADLPDNFHILAIGPIGSRRDYVEFRRDGETHTVSTGCFADTPDAFVAAVMHKAPDDPHRRAYEAVVIPAMRAWFAQFEVKETE